MVRFQSSPEPLPETPSFPSPASSAAAPLRYGPQLRGVEHQRGPRSDSGGLAHFPLGAPAVAGITGLMAHWSIGAE